MASPTITSLSTTFGPPGQWVYIFGTDFVDGQTQVYFNNIAAEPVAVFSPTNIGFYLPSEVSGTGYFKVVTPEGEVTSNILYTVGSPTQPPVITAVREHPVKESSWIYIDGNNFVARNTTLTYNGNVCDVFVYKPESAGFKRINPSDQITSITLTTPNGSTQYDCNPAV